MALTEGQVQINDVVIGPGTHYHLPEEFNPWNYEVRADQGGARAWNHGGWSGAEWVSERTVPLRIIVLGSTPAEVLDRHHTLAAQFAPRGDRPEDVEVRFMRAGREYALFGRPRMVEAEVRALGQGISYVNSAIVALDPRIYAGALSTAGPITLPRFEGGLTLPVSAPFSIGATLTGGTASLTNIGKTEVPLTLRIDGPVDRPRIVMQYNDGASATLRFDVDLWFGQYLEVDTGARSVVLNGTSSRRGQTAGDFPLLPPGTHTIRFLAAAGDGTLTVTYREGAWW